MKVALLWNLNKRLACAYPRPLSSREAPATVAVGRQACAQDRHVRQTSTQKGDQDNHTHTACVRCVAGTSLAADQSALGSKVGKGLSKVEALATQYRVEKKKVLVACLSSLGMDMSQQASAATAGAA